MQSRKRLDMRPDAVAVLHVDGLSPASPSDVVASPIFDQVVTSYVVRVLQTSPGLVESLRGLVSSRKPERVVGAVTHGHAEADTDPAAEAAAIAGRLSDLLKALATDSLDRVPRELLGPAVASGAPPEPEPLWALVEGLYDHWRSFDRFLICHEEAHHDREQPGRRHRRFNAAAESLQAAVRGLYRDIEENITGDHPRVYRQVAAAWNVAVLAAPCPWQPPSRYRGRLEGIDTIRQLIVHPPLILDPPSNMRAGAFARVHDDPLAGVKLNPVQWLCYPAKVGPLTVFIYFHESFIGLGCSLANLFELADDDAVAAGPDAVFLFGVPGGEALARYGDVPTVFFEDEEAGFPVGVVPCEPRFGYFGYLKKMVLTLHNVVMMRQGRMPFHGALYVIGIADGREATALLIGDTATGKSETLEALRLLGPEEVRGLTIVADDMGSLEVGDDGRLYGRGTETGAFIRLDDLQKGYAWDQVDRAVIMSPQKVNARVVLPVTTLEEVLRRHRVDALLYANNYEQIDEEHPVLERFETASAALRVFREGMAMSKGTTAARGLTHSYFANVFGPAQYRELHEPIARDVFEAAFDAGVFVGQLRTRLAIPGLEAEGPRAAARALVQMVRSMHRDR